MLSSLYASISYQKWNKAYNCRRLLFFFSLTNPQLTVNLPAVVFARSLDAQQQKHGFTGKPEHGWKTLSGLGFQVFSRTRSNPASLLPFLQYRLVNTLAPVCMLWASWTTEMPCKTPQWAQDALLSVKVGSTAAFLMQQCNPHSTWTGNVITYLILYVLKTRNKHSYRNVVIKRWLTEHLSLKSG